MNQKQPIILIHQPLTIDMAVKGMDFITSSLGLTSDISLSHPLRSMYEKAKKHQSTSSMTWGPSREFNLLALWGLQLSMVQDWPGFEGLIRRVKTDEDTWDAHLFEASVASLFYLACCKGEFFELKSEPGPDLRVSNGYLAALVECKRSRPLTDQERKNRENWDPAASQVAYYLREQVPSAAARFYPTRHAKPNDPGLLVAGIERAIASWRQYAKAPSSKDWGYTDIRASDGSFTARVAVANNPDVVFDAAAEGHRGIEVPGDTEPVALILDITLSKPPKCDGIWYVKVHTKRDWPSVEEAVLRRFYSKASQLNRFHLSGSKDSSLPGIVWIDHPPLIDATTDDLNQLAGRIHSKLEKNEDGRFNAVASVVLTHSRMVLNKHGQLEPQDRFKVVSNPSDSSSLQEKFPYVSSNWWNTAKSNQLPTKQVMGVGMGLGPIPST